MMAMACLVSNTPGALDTAAKENRSVSFAPRSPSVKLVATRR